MHELKHIGQATRLPQHETGIPWFGLVMAGLLLIVVLMVVGAISTYAFGFNLFTTLPNGTQVR